VDRVNLLDLDSAQVAAFVASLDEKPFRARQLTRWIHRRGAGQFDAMTDLAKSLRTKLADVAEIKSPGVIRDSTSDDGTRKWLIRTAPGIEIETVYIPDVGRAGALCVSSQVGCTLNCTFCHTGTQKLVRNLTAAEIVARPEVRIERRHVRWTLSSASPLGPGDQVYADPPYHDPGAFVSYSGGWTRLDQDELMIRLRDVAARGARVVVSQPAHIKLVREWERHGFVVAAEIDVRRSIGAKAVRRGKVGEVLLAAGG
jgi:hypothetical protein